MNTNPKLTNLIFGLQILSKYYTHEIINPMTADNMSILLNPTHLPLSTEDVLNMINMGWSQYFLKQISPEDYKPYLAWIYTFYTETNEQKTE